MNRRSSKSPGQEQDEVWHWLFWTVIVIAVVTTLWEVIR